MLLDELNAQRDAIAALGRRYGARRIRVFGSVARRQETAGSDIDLLVDLPPGYDMFGQRLPLAQQLEQQLGRRIELIPEHELNQHMREHVLREAVDL
ncbi:nucleotidyltransferase domain-containing protein [Ottowia beijingensis]|uniref:Nucleotidyltransferase domain-containing protein n=1 Tax=Ottowia beijingensis TaxID=1207057 RepID=A0A853IVB2_9BURK|nr:nucleotidyltransferase domain-containing protein [Ottowia beijingensis]NZA01921.1 nucleotidyltransferase domain-containing protein [Ottowia beijingensis]